MGTSIYVCEYICIYMCVYTYVYIYIYVLVCIYICVYIYACVYMYACVYIYIYMYVYICMCVYIHTCVWVYTYIYIYIYIYIYMGGVYVEKGKNGRKTSWVIVLLCFDFKVLSEYINISSEIIFVWEIFIIENFWFSWKSSSGLADIVMRKTK